MFHGIGLPIDEDQMHSLHPMAFILIGHEGEGRSSLGSEVPNRLWYLSRDVGKGKSLFRRFITEPFFFAEATFREDMNGGKKGVISLSMEEDHDCRMQGMWKEIYG